MIRLMTSHSEALYLQSHALRSRTRGDFEMADRAEMGAAVIASLNAAGIPYCVLGESSSGLAFSGSDMDFAVSPEYAREVPALLAVAASAAGAQFVQAIQHESTGWYFVMARQRGDKVCFFNPDCTTDYRRKGRLWLYADELLRERNFEDGVAWPAAQGNFTYYLLKQVLKGTLSGEQWRKLRKLHIANGSRCDIDNFWGGSTLAKLQWALLQGNRRWVDAHRQELLEELRGSAWREPLMARIYARGGETYRLFRRLLQPTGLLVRIGVGSAAEQSKLAQALVESMSPAFRRSWLVGVASGSEPARMGARVFGALVASTFVVTTEANAWAARRFGAVELTVRAELSAEDNLRLAIQRVLDHMEFRTARRLGLASAAQPNQLILTAESERN